MFNWAKRFSGGADQDKSDSQETISIGGSQGEDNFGTDSDRYTSDSDDDSMNGSQNSPISPILKEEHMEDNSKAIVPVLTVDKEPLTSVPSQQNYLVLCSAFTEEAGPSQNNMVTPLSSPGEDTTRERTFQEFRDLIRQTFNVDLEELLAGEASRSQRVPFSTVTAQPKDFFIYHESELQFSFEMGTFYLQRSDESTSTPPTFIDDFVVRIITPRDELSNGKIRIDLTSPNRCICSFYACEPGVYYAEVRLRSKGHVGGSPLKITVSRPYVGSDIRIYNKTETLDGHKTGWRFFDQRGCWGLAYNSLREDLYTVDEKHCNISTRSFNGHLKYKYTFESNDPGGIGALCLPSDLTYDSVWDRIIVVDRGHHRICFFTPKGRFLGGFGKKGHENGELFFPWGVAVSPRGDRIAVTDSDNGRMQIFDHNGRFLQLWSNLEPMAPGQSDYFGNLRGITFDPQGERIYFVDAMMNKIYTCNAEGMARTCLNLATPGLLQQPQGLTVDKVGNLLVADTGHNCVRIISQKGTLIYTREGLGSNLSEDGPLGICCLNDGSVVVVNRQEELSIF